MAQPDLSIPVVFVSSHAKAGGAERYLETLAEQLGPSWVRSVVCLEDGPLVERLRSAGLPTEVLPTSPRAWGIAGSALQLRRLLRRERPALVHANGIKAALVSVLAGRVPVVWVKHDFSFDGTLARLVAARCRLVVGVSEAVTKTFPARTRRRKVDVVHNGLGPVRTDRETGRLVLGEALGISPGPAVALVSRLDPAKGHRELLGVAKGLLERFPDLKLVFVGGPDAAHQGYEGVLRREVREQGVEETVVFLGQRDDAEALIAGCDLLVIPTVVREGFPYVGLEAMAAGTPVVGYAHGGVPELVGPCGALVAPGDRNALGGEIARLLGDEKARESMAACGRERVAREFSLEHMVEAMKDGYRRAAGN